MIELLPDTYKVGRLRHKLAHLSSLVSWSSIFSFRSRVHCVICFLRQHLLDSCVRESDDDHNSADYHVILQHSHTSKEAARLRLSALTATPLCTLQIEYSFRWLQTPLEKRLWEKNGYRPLAAVNVINTIVITSNPSGKCFSPYRLWLLCAGHGVLQPPRAPQSPRLQKVPCNEMVRIGALTPAWVTFVIWIRQKMIIGLFHSGFSSSNLPISLYPALPRVAYGSKAHFLNILLYLLGLMPLTYLIVSLRPSMSTNGTGDHNITMVKVSFQEVLKKLRQSFLHICHTRLLILALCFLICVFKQSVVLSFCMMMVLVMNIYAIIKELVQMSQQVGPRPGYVMSYDMILCGGFLFMLLSLCFIAAEILQGLFQSVGLVCSYLLSYLHHSRHAQCGKLFTMAGRSDGGFAVLDRTSHVSAEVLSSLDVLFRCLDATKGYIVSSSRRFEGVGIYVVMLSEIMRTLFRVVLLFFFLILAFSLAFHALMLNQVGKPWRAT